jgi:uncharacterized protein YqeY
MVQIDELIKDAMHQKNRELLNVLKLIKAEFLKKQTEPGRKTKELTDEEQTKVLLKMASQREDSIQQYVNGGRQDLAEAEKKELEIINEFTPKQPTDEELSEFVGGVITGYKITKGDGYKLSMKDMKPIMDIVKEKYPTANGKIISQTLQKVING